MITANQNGTIVETTFSKEAIDKQLQKMISDPVFIDSDILKSFLVFVVNETLNGNRNRLKEYTIAVNVLHKPINFRPQDSGIVRIHAGRLRRALNNYYCQAGILDEIRIAIPKGGYVPVFIDNEEEDVSARVNSSLKPTVIGIAPFRNASDNPTSNSFTDGIGVQLSTALMQLEHFTVVSYYTMRNLSSKYDDIEKSAISAGLQYMVTGDLQMLKGSLRLHLQLMRVRTGQLIWSQMYEKKFSAEKLFGVQDDIVKEAITDLSQLVL
jgi:TolB-like protein